MSRTFGLWARGSAVALLGLAGCAGAPPHPELQQTSIVQLRRDLDSGATTSVALVRAYLERIQALDRQGPQLHAVLSLNPDALAQAQALDRELRTSGPRSRLHGIPLLVKDNIESADPLPTTAGSLALRENVTRRDAPVVARLRAAGMVILGKTNLSEWANFRSPRSLSGWSAVGGLTRNPHVLDRTACGSSSGSAVAVAAALAPASLGTETDGSIVCPAAMNGVVGLKPTLGALPTEHIVPIAHSQDVPGPMAATVQDVAWLFDALRFSCTEQACKQAGKSVHLDAEALRGKRIGVLRFAANRNPHLEPVYARALEALRAAGATLVEIATLDMTQIDAAEATVLHAEFRQDIESYLAGTAVRQRTLDDLIAFNRETPQELALFGQETFEQAARTPQDETYRRALLEGKRLARTQGLDRLFREHELDVIVAPTTGTAWRVDMINGNRFPGSFSTLPAVAGYPHLTVPMGDVEQLPVGLSFIGPAHSEPLLLNMGYAFETRLPARPRPGYIESLEKLEFTFAQTVFATR